MAAAMSAMSLSTCVSTSPIASRNVRRSVDRSVRKVALAASRRPVQQSCLLGERLALTVSVELAAAKGRNTCARAAAHDAARTLAGSLPAAALASLVVALTGEAAMAADIAPPTQPVAEAVQAVKQAASKPFADASLTAPATDAKKVDLPEGSQWRYSEFINAVKGGKVERVRFSKDGSSLQVIIKHGPFLNL